MGKFKMSGHTLKGPNQKASIGKNLQDYKMVDGKLVAISSGEFDEAISDLKDPMSDNYDPNKVQLTSSTANADDYVDGQYVSDKNTGYQRKIADTKNNLKAVEEFVPKGSKVYRNTLDSVDRQAVKDGVITGGGDSQIFETKAAKLDNMKQAKVDNQAKQSGNMPGPSKKMKFGRKKK
jgi:hypothetical protein|tara:strand:+ start:33 stop:566 length:534 start_codon:yes stop_codon:yes gene_type:complete